MSTRSLSSSLNAHFSQTNSTSQEIISASVKLACLCMSFPLLAQAQSPTNPVDAQQLDSNTKPPQIVVVSGNRYEQFLENIPLSMDVVQDKEIERLNILTIRDLVKNLPNVEMKRSPARFTVTGVGNATGRDGNAGFSIRGQDGNRVIMLIDGVRLPRSYINGSNAFGRDSVSMNLIRQVEVIRGPSSVLYGSDGLAGLVNFMTLEPKDFLQEKNTIDKNYGGKISASWSGDDNSRLLSTSVAGRIDHQLSWLISGSIGKSEGLKNQGTLDVPNVDRTTPNPQQDKSQSALFKLVYQINDQQKHTLNVEHIDKISDFDLLSSRAKLPMTSPSAVKGESVHKTSQRDRISIVSRYDLKNNWLDYLQSNLSFQNSHAQDNGITQRNTLADRVRNVSYDEKAWQFNLQADKLLTSSKQFSQRLSYGIDYSQIDVSNFFDGVDPGNVSFKPRKYFPDTRDSSRAVYIQDEIFIPHWIITSGLRYDDFNLNVKSQAGFYPPSSTPGKSLTGSAIVPKLGTLYKITPHWNAYTNFSGGFRAPNAQQINGVFDSLVVPAVLLSNPNLKPEKSQHIEIGLRALFDQINVDVAVFSGLYQDLIYDKKPLGGKGVIGDPAIFQTVNIEKAKISGYEVRGQIRWAEIAGGKLSTPFSYGTTKGRNTVDNTPLNSVNPSKVYIGLRYENNRIDWQLNARHQDAKTEDDLSSPYLPKPALPPRIRQFLIPAAVTYDMQLQWKFNKNLRINMGVDNISNKKYWNWTDVQGLAANSLVVDAYTQPGRYYYASIVKSF